ncbi:MAG: hypothetical protein RL363_1259 [Bacteroidota bacterium]|jgi:hypothetical protein
MAQEIEVKVKVTTEQAVNSVDKLGNAFDQTAKDAKEAQEVFAKAGNGVKVEESIAGLKQLKRELKNVAVGSEEFKKLYNDIDDLEDKLKSAKNTSSDWVDSLESAGGPLGMLGAGINRAKVATQTFGGALKATGIGLIVALLSGLAGAFANNEGAMKKLQPLLDGISKTFQGVFRAVEPLFNTLVDLAISALPMVQKAFGSVYSVVTATLQSFGAIGSAIGKLMEGDFKGAWNSAKSSVSDFGKNYDASLKRFEAGAKELTKTEKLSADERQKIRDKEIADKVIRDEKEKARQEKIAEEEKKKLEALRSNAERAREEYEKAQKILTDARKANEDSLKTENEIKVEQENADFETKKEALINAGLSIEEIEIEHKRKLAELNDQYYANESTKSIERDAIEKENKAKADEEKLKSETEIQNAILSVVTNGQALMGALQDAGIAKGKAGQAIMKSLALVQIGLDTAQALSSAVPMAINAGKEAAKFAGPAAPFVGPIATATSYVTSAAMIASNIMKAKKLLGGGGPSVPSAGGGGGGSISTPTAMPVNPAVVGDSGVNQLASTLSQTPLKTYVVAKDVTTQQSLDRNITDTATLG